MVRGLLIRGMLAGILAGLVAFAFAWMVGEPQIDRAVAFERHMAKAAIEPELVGRPVQSGIGLFVGIDVYSSALGGLFALVFAYGYGRIGRLGPRPTAALLAALGFVMLILVPQLKYPAAPPAVGDAATIGTRSALYLTMIALSLLSGMAASSTARLLAGRLGLWNGVLAAAAVYIAAVATAMLVLPSVDEVPAGFSATALWNFRLASLGVEAVLWATLGLVFGALAERLLVAADRHPDRRGSIR